MARKPIPTFDSIKEEYGRLWSTLKLDAPRIGELDKVAKDICKNRARYEQVEKATGVPWRWIAIVHVREASLDFGKHLHCGDPLTARTKNEPKGHPVAPPADGKCYSWEESAEDALRLKDLDKITEWSVERMAYEFERFNGFGYRLYHSDDGLTPYLWAATNHHDETGKYWSDGKYKADAPEKQLGTMALLRRLHDQTGNTEPDCEAQRPKTFIEKLKDIIS